MNKYMTMENWWHKSEEMEHDVHDASRADGGGGVAENQPGVSFPDGFDVF